MSDDENEGDNDQQEQNQYEWSAFYDDEGRLYYYNSVTEESAWDEPEGGFNPPPEDEGEATAKEDEEKKDEEKQSENESDEPKESSQTASSPRDNQDTPWIAHKDEEGNEYYYNRETEETSWEKPEHYITEEEAAALEAKQESSTSDAAVGDATDSTPNDPDAKKDTPWVALKDEEGNEYYYNRETEETSWEKPEHYMTEEEAAALDAKDETVVAATESGAKKDTPWIAHKDEEGNEYYYNRETEETSWEKPDHYITEEEAAAIEEEKEDTAVATTNKSDAKKDTPWVALKDEEGNEYYYNRETEETSWDQPEHYMTEEEAAALDAKQEESQANEESPAGEQEEKKEEATTERAATADTSHIPWIAYTDEEGREYYFNRDTEETSWDKPDQYIPAEELEEADEEQPVDGQKPMDVDEEPKEEDVEMEPEPEPEPEIDPEVLKLQQAEEALNRPDSILEPSCIANVSIVVPAHGGNPEKAIKALIDTYHGQTAVCGLLARWYIDFKQQAREAKQNATQKGSKAATEAAAEAVPKKATERRTSTIAPAGVDHSENDANHIREVAQEVINRIAKEKFSREAGDAILDLDKSDAAFLEDMMDSTRWRKLLIDLSASHKDSAVLLHCLRAISKRGHHREIARRINQSDHFAVFNAMLLSELAVIGNLAISAGNDVASSSGWEELLNDLLRACSATSYTYLYSVEMLRMLETKALEEAATESDRPIEECRFLRAVRKWQALSQSLENIMVDPHAGQSVAGSSPIFRKRRLDVALCISELHQRQRRRKLNSDGTIEVNYNSNGNNESKDDPKDLETAMIMLLRRYSTGTNIGDAVMDKLLPSGLDLNTRGVGKILLNHPLAIKALMGHLYKPGTTRATHAGTKNKCARLVALAVLAAEQQARDEISTHKDEDGADNDNFEEGEESEKDDVALTRQIVQGSQLCEHLETLISFSVTTDMPTVGAQSPGQKLCTLAFKCAPVAMGVMMWAREFTHGPEFAQSASFPTLSTSILSLVRLVAVRQPFTRADALEIALAFLRHANPDISYQKINLIKEQSLRLMVFLLMKGDVAPVLTAISKRLASKTSTSELDASLVRYFVASILEVVEPPVSPVFVRLFSGLLKAPRTIDAVRSTYFATENRKRLTRLLRSFRTVKLPDGSPLGKEDSAMLASLFMTYQVE